VAYLPGSPIQLGYEERLLRQYAAVQVRRRQQGEGILYVTDSRIVFYARAKGRGTQRPSALMQQTKLSEVTGVSAFVFRRFSLILFLSAFWFSVFGLSTLLVFPPAALFWLVLAALCIVAIIGGGARRGSTGVEIHSKSDGSSALQFGSFGSRRGWIGNITHSFTGPILSIFGVYTVADVIFGLPGQDADRVISELGALILDLQTRGDLAFDHYGARGEQAQRGLADQGIG
jgi:hypothetical protein